MRDMDEFPGETREPRRDEVEPAASPYAGPDLAPGTPPPPGAGGRRIGLGLAALAAIVGIAWWALSPRTTTVPPAGGGKREQVLPPLRAEAVPGTGEVVAPFSGFAVSVESLPPGAVVTIEGIPRGEAPVLAGLDCSPGDRIEVSAEKRGFAVARAVTTCREDALVKLTLRLRR